jgi:hypothetical protein
MSMRDKVRWLLRKVTTVLLSGLHWAIFLILIWLAYKLGIYERGGGVGDLVFVLVVLVVGALSMSYVRRRFRARVPGPRPRL